MIYSPDELKNVFTTAAVLMNMESFSQEILDDVILEVDIHRWCMDLEKAGIISDGEKVYALIEDSDEWGTFNKVLSVLGINEGEECGEDFPLSYYLGALHFSAHEDTRKYLYEEAAKYTQREWNMFYHDFSEEQIKICQDWKCSENI